MKKYLSINIVLFFYGSFSTIYGQSMTFSTTSEKALSHYKEAWRLILDEGFYGPSEDQFKLAYQTDSTFVLAALNYGRIIKHIPTQEHILYEARLSKLLNTDEKLLSSIFSDLLAMTIAREKKMPIDDKERKEMLIHAKANFYEIVRKYKHEPYSLSEYIEVIHHLHGPKAASDSIEHYRKEGYQIPLFLDAYKISLLIKMNELSNLKTSIKSIKKQVPYAPKSYVLKSEYFYALGKSKKAIKYINQALKFDSKCIDALRMKEKILNNS